MSSVFSDMKKKAKAKAYDVTGTIPPKEIQKEEVAQDDASQSLRREFHTANPFDEPDFVAGLHELDEFEAEKIHAKAPRYR